MFQAGGFGPMTGHDPPRLRDAGRDRSPSDLGCLTHGSAWPVPADRKFKHPLSHATGREPPPGLPSTSPPCGRIPRTRRAQSSRLSIRPRKRGAVSVFSLPIGDRIVITRAVSTEATGSDPMIGLAQAASVFSHCWPFLAFFQPARCASRRSLKNADAPRVSTEAGSHTRLFHTFSAPQKKQPPRELQAFDLCNYFWWAVQVLNLRPLPCE